MAEWVLAAPRTMSADRAHGTPSLRLSPPSCYSWTWWVDIVIASLISILSFSHYVAATGLERDWPPRSERGPRLVWLWLPFSTSLVIGSGLGNGSTVDPFKVKDVYLLMVGRNFILPLRPIPCFPLFLQDRWVNEVLWYLTWFGLDLLLAL